MTDRDLLEIAKEAGFLAVLVPTEKIVVDSKATPHKCQKPHYTVGAK